MSSEPLRTEPPPRTALERAQRLHSAGLKATAPRLAVLEVLETSAAHPSAEQVLAELRELHPSLSLSTVYKTLEAFLAAGLCRRVAGDRTRLRVDGTLRPHDYAVCRGCGRIFDVPPALAAPARLPVRLPGGLKVSAVRLEYDVICRECAAPDRRSAAAGDAPHAPRPEGIRATVRARETTREV